MTNTETATTAPLADITVRVRSLEPGDTIVDPDNAQIGHQVVDIRIDPTVPGGSHRIVLVSPGVIRHYHENDEVTAEAHAPEFDLEHGSVSGQARRAARHLRWQATAWERAGDTAYAAGLRTGANHLADLDSRLRSARSA